MISYDNISYATAITPELTTIAQPITELGEGVFALLLKESKTPPAHPNRSR